MNRDIRPEGIPEINSWVKKENIGIYLMLVTALWAFCFVTLKLWLMPYSIDHAETGILTPGYLAYAAIGLLLSTPAPFLSVFIIAVCKEKCGIRDFFRWITYNPYKMRTLVLTGVFCLTAFVYALLFGKPNGEPWYLFPLGFLVMIPFVGIAEESGWRGFLQPAIEKKIPYPFSVFLVAAVWYSWHLDLWLDTTSNHYGDSLIGFGITIFIWAFALAALYKATKSILACALYHAFVDAIGAVYDWNGLFDPFPGGLPANIFRFVWLGISVLVWIWAERKDKKSTCSN